MTIFNAHYQQTKAYSARLDRQLIQDIYKTEGILYDTDFVATPVTGYQLSVSRGRCFVQGDSNADQGMYRFFSDAAELRTATPDAINPRIDLIVAHVYDALEVGSGSTTSDIELLPGTATAGASTANLTGGPGQAGGPAIPATACPLWYVRVPTTGGLAAGDFVDARPRTGGQPGLVVPTMRSTPDDGHLMCDGSLQRRVTFPRLATIMIAIPGHAGDGSTTFKLPELNKGRIPVGRDPAQTEFDVLGETGGEKTHLNTSGESGLPGHGHADSFAVSSVQPWTAAWNVPIANTSWQEISFLAGSGGALQDIPMAGLLGEDATIGWSSGAHSHPLTGGVSNAAAANAAAAHNNVQPYQVVHYQIRA